jgi:hypothetical protein
MSNFNFKKYLQQFELEVITSGVSRETIGKTMLVNVREGRFAYTKFARLLGERVASMTPFVVDYYGYLKRSEGFINLIRSKEEAIRNRQIKSIQTTIVFFAGLKIEEIAETTNNQYLKSRFTEFKKTILYWRGFEQRSKKGMAK